MALKVAIVGASGIGQHHARWHHLSGSEVVAFVGQTQDSCRQTAQRLKDYFGFEGRFYTNLAHMLEKEKPDVVDICSPFQLHRTHAEAVFRAGCHVICEKPLCWDLDKSLDEIVSDGEAVIAASEAGPGKIVMSAQYPASIPIYRDFYIQERGQWDDVSSVFMEMEVNGRKGPKFGEDIWIDLASHPLSLALGFLPGYEIDWQSAHCEIAERENRARFEMVGNGQRSVVEFVLRDIDEGVPVRRFGVNDFLVDWHGYADAEGIYRAKLVREGREVLCNDFMHILIEDFAKYICGDGGQVWVSGEQALNNLKYQIMLLQRAERPS
ncbi:MAG: Gfo/Idh/MocA family oxidoreductase [Candidatus Latescibacteria bacterium]|jgi:predicted dehydrogenase|nr:Gfo/Idh/MocA family oxidoreductase [Candidatus Latescibacterota bacterium]